MIGQQVFLQPKSPCLALVLKQKAVFLKQPVETFPCFGQQVERVSVLIQEGVRLAVLITDREGTYGG